MIITVTNLLKVVIKIQISHCHYIYDIYDRFVRTEQFLVQ